METAWIHGLLGGLLIGLAAAIYLLGNGRIMGISGILGGLVDGSAGNRLERVCFLVGLVGAPAVVAATLGATPTHAPSSIGLLVLAGGLVGIGTRLGDGCTSGHGVCGLSRLSGRSAVATLAFMGSGIAVVTLGRHLFGFL
ncbi:MAG: YeeE/YedE family protein [Burkholderiaceae bacterium]